MRPRRPVARVSMLVTVAVVAGAALGACSDDDGATRGTDGPTTTVAAAVSGPGATAGTSSDVGAAGTVPGTAPVGTLATVPEVGVPGLESDDAVCRSWSRFGGSFQVVAVAASFGSGDPIGVAALEVIAAPTVTAAYDELIANWPDELAAEAEAVADDFLGPFARRAERAVAALDSAGADPAAIATLVGAWESALAARDPESAEITVDLPDDVQGIVDAAAAEVAAQLVPIPSDPSLVTDVDVPLTEQYFVDNCPDRGTLGGIDE